MNMNNFIKSTLAGMMISISAITYASVSADNKYVGAFLFSLGLVSIILLNFNLFTGKIGYAKLNKDNFYFNLTCLLGNIFGCSICAAIKPANEAIIHIVTNKLNVNMLDTFFSAVFCGILIYICVEIYKQKNKLLGIMLCIPAFILSGFDHCIANTYYFFSVRDFSLQVWIYLLIAVLGNSAGSIIMNNLNRISIKES